MANSIPKISIGKSVKKHELMDLSRDVTTTAHWGFVQPLMCKEMVPTETLTVGVNSFVRLSPMVAPTMARCTYNIYHQFVPIAELWEAFESFLSQTPYHMSNGTSSYIPTSVPSISLGLLSRAVLNMFSEMTVYKLQSPSEDVTNHKWNYTGVTVLTDSAAATEYGKTLFPTYVAGLAPAHPRQSNDSMITDDASDFVYYFKDGSSYYKVNYRLLRGGRNVRQILLGLGYQLNAISTQNVSILPICAYYKAWFDIFAIQRKFTWKDTNVAKLLMYILSNNLPVISSISATVGQLFKNVLYDLMDCYYTENPDYVSMAQANIADTYSTDSPYFVDYNGNTNQRISVAGTTYQPNISEVQPLGQTRLDLLERLSRMVNKNTLIGGRVGAYLAAHYGAQFVDSHNSNYVGSDVINVEIGDVMQTAGTDYGYLGEYAGRGVGTGSAENKKFNASTFGYYITLATVVPHGSYFQGIDRNNTHISRYDFYTPEFDSVGYQVMRVNEVMAKNDVYGTDDNYNIKSESSFGFVPRYSEYKTAHNIVNGDISLRSTATSLMPYTLDKEISDSVITKTSDNAYTVSFNHGGDLVASNDWRYVGKFPWRTNFNRIFVNEGTDSYFYEENNDNFIIHNVIDVKSSAPMLSLSKSFDTWDENNDNGSIDVEKV